MTRPRTLAEVGRLAGVSAATVSRALADSPLVNAETRARIRELAALHDFRPNPLAKRLRTGSKGLIGIVIPLGHERRQHVSDPFFMAMLGQLADALTERGRDILLSRVIPRSPDWIDRVIDGGLVDGVLLIGQSDQMEAIDRAAARYLPLVAWGAVEPGRAHCAIGTDNRLGGRLATEHLLARGARRVAFLGDIRAPEIMVRHQGCRDALADAALGEPLLLRIGLAADAVEPELARLIDTHLGRFDGIVAASDVIAMAVMRVLADRGVRVPDDVRLVGYDDLPLATQTVPRLTTVRQDIAAGAREMVSALFDRMAGRASSSRILMPELIERDSA